MRTVAVGKDRYLVIGSKRALNSAQGVVHLFHHVGGQALVDDKNDRQRGRIDGEEAQRLAGVVLKDPEIPPGEAGDQLSLCVLDGDRDFDEVDVDVECRELGHSLSGRGQLWRRGLEVVLSLGRRRKAAGRSLLIVSGGGRGGTGSGLFVARAFARRNRGAVRARQLRRRLGRRSIRDRGLLLGHRRGRYDQPQIQNCRQRPCS